MEFPIDHVDQDKSMSCIQVSDLKSIYLTKMLGFNSMSLIQKFYTSYTIMANNSYIEYVLIKISDDWKILCKLSPQVLTTSAFGYCDVSVLKRTSKKLVHPLSVKLDKTFDLNDVRPICVADTKRIIVSVVFQQVEHQNIWSKNQTQLVEAIRHLLRLYVVHNDSVVSLKRLGLKQKYNVDFILVHKTDYHNKGARITLETNIMIIRTMCTDQYNQVEIGSEVKPLYGMEPQVSQLKSIIKAAMKSSSPLCNMILLIGPSGSGKTSLVNHVSASLRCILFNLTSTDFIHSDPGATELTIRSLFKKAQLLVEQDDKVVCIIMLEKAESVLNGKSANAKRMCDQIQDCLMAVRKYSRLIVIATTSMPHLIDPSFKQGSRFSYEIYISVPSEKDRVKLIKGIGVLSNIHFDHKVALSLAKLTPGYTAADLKLIFKEVCYENHIISELEMGVISSVLPIIVKNPASSLRSGIGQVITKSELNPATNLGGLTKIKLMFDVCIKWPLIYPKVFKKFSVPPPKGVLLYGPPGCGKTSLVRSVASSANLNVLTAMAAELYSPYLGVTEANISQLFQRARANLPALLFIDEIDSLVSCRTEDKTSSGFDNRVLSTFLIEMDGICNDTEHGQGIVVVAATNRPDKIDTALLRPGRFDRLIYVPPPVSAEDRFNILSTIINNPDQSMPISDSSILNEVAIMTDLFSGADLANVLKEAGLSCLTKDGLELCTSVKKEHFEDALTYVKPSLSTEQILWYRNFSSERENKFKNIKNL